MPAELARTLGSASNQPGRASRQSPDGRSPSLLRALQPVKTGVNLPSFPDLVAGLGLDRRAYLIEGTIVSAPALGV